MLIVIIIIFNTANMLLTIVMMQTGLCESNWQLCIAVLAIYSDKN